MHTVLHDAEAEESVIEDQPQELRGWLARHPRTVHAVLLGLLVFAPAAPLLFSCYVLSLSNFPDFILDGDGALCELAIRTIGGEGPWVGAYSRLGFHHPGPLHYYTLAPAYWLVGGTATGLMLGAALLCSVLLSSSVLVIGRALGLCGALPTALVATGFVTLHTSECLSTWEPALARIALLACIAGVTAAACGRRSGLFLAILAGSLAVQAHLSFAPPVAAAGLAIVLGFRTGTGRNLQARDLCVGIALALVLWTPPLLEQVGLLDRARPGSGNLSRIVEALGVNRTTLGGAEVWGYAIGALTADTARVLGLTPMGAPTTLVMLQLLFGLWLLRIGWKRSSRGLLAAAAVSIALHAVTVFAASRVFGGYANHLLVFASLAPYLLLASVLAIATHAERPQRLRIAMVTLTSVALAGLVVQSGMRGGVTVVQVITQPNILSQPGFATSLPELAETLTARGVEVIVVETSRLNDLGTNAGLVLGLSKRGFAVRPSADQAWAFPGPVGKVSDVDQGVTRLRLGPTRPNALSLTVQTAVEILPPK